MSRIRLTSPTITATKMRLVLSVTLVLIIAAMATGFYFVYLYLQKVSDEAAAVQTTANSSDASVQALLRTKQELATYGDTVQKAQQIVAESQSYRYQEQVIRDISEYARRASIPVTSITFQGASSADTASAATPPASSGANKPTANGGVKNTTVSVALAPNIPYANLLHFIHLIEENLTRMQITQVSIARGDSPDTVTAQAFNIEVFLR